MAPRFLSFAQALPIARRPPQMFGVGPLGRQRRNFALDRLAHLPQVQKRGLVAAQQQAQAGHRGFRG
jgi:hypothetical protein